ELAARPTLPDGERQVHAPLVGVDGPGPLDDETILQVVLAATRSGAVLLDDEPYHVELAGAEQPGQEVHDFVPGLRLGEVVGRAADLDVERDGPRRGHPPLGDAGQLEELVKPQVPDREPD